MQYCPEPGCPSKVKRGRCDVHKREHQRRDAKQRGTARERGYDRTWEQVREHYARKHPLCEDCEQEGGIPKLLDVVHHIVPLADGGPRLDEANLRSLCNAHHQREHERLRKNRERGESKNGFLSGTLRQGTAPKKSFYADDSRFGDS